MGRARWCQLSRAKLRPWRLPQAMSLFVGRVCGESEGGRLAEGDLLLEGSLASSSGARVALDLSRLPAFRLFPGQARGLPRLSRGCPEAHTCRARLLPRRQEMLRFRMPRGRCCEAALCRFPLAMSDIGISVSSCNRGRSCRLICRKAVVGLFV